MTRQNDLCILDFSVGLDVLYDLKPGGLQNIEGFGHGAFLTFRETLFARGRHFRSTGDPVDGVAQSAHHQ